VPHESRLGRAPLVHVRQAINRTIQVCHRHQPCAWQHPEDILHHPINKSCRQEWKAQKELSLGQVYERCQEDMGSIPIICWKELPEKAQVLSQICS